MFGLGASKSDTKTTSDAQSTDFSNAQSFGQSGQDVFASQLFQQLYGDAFGATGKIAANLPTYQGDAAALFSGGTDFLKSLSGDAGSNYLTDRLSGDDSILQEQIGGLGSDLGKFFNEQLLPGITSDSISSGMGPGSGRDQVARGSAAGEVTRQFTQGVTQLRSADQQQRDAAAGTLTNARTAAAGVGLNGLNNVLGLSQAGLTADMLPQQLLAQILGGPTTLTSSLEGSASTSYGQSTATSKSKGKSGGFNFSTSGAFGG